MSKWSSVKVGDTVSLAGRELEVVKAKPKKSGLEVTVRDGRGTFTSKVDPSAKVKIVTPPLHDGAGRQARWATASDSVSRADEPRRETLPAGDPAVTRRPAKATGGPWDAPKGKAERAVEEILGATLVGEATDENVGYYVPPVDLSTVAAHLLLFHGVTGADYSTPMQALELHQNHHADAKAGAAMKVTHWHAKERP